MSLHQYRFERVEQYLHHRPPYLMVEQIVSISASDVVTEKTIRGDEYFLAGHFPGAPIVPGAMLHELTTQSAGVLIAAEYNPMARYDTSDPYVNEYALGVLVRAQRARYKSFARPGDVLRAHVKLVERLDNLFDFQTQVTARGQVIMRNEFQLTNIPSRLLQA